MMAKFDYKWFKNLTDKELSDIAYMAAMHVETELPSHTRDLLAALAHRLEQETPESIMRQMDVVFDHVIKLQEKIKNSHDPNDEANGL